MKVAELRTKMSDTTNKMRGILDKADAEKRNLSDDETKEYQTLENSIGELRAAIEREEKLEALESEMRQVVRKLEGPAVIIDGKSNDDKSFRNIGEFVYTIAANPRDKRLEEFRAQSMADGSLGGFAVPPQFRQDLLSVAPQAALVRPRATVIPAGTPPDSEFSIPSLDQTAAQNIYGGIVIYNVGESDGLTESNVRLKKINLKPKKKIGYTTTSNEMLRNWDAFSGLISGQLQKAITGSEDYDFIRGNGVNVSRGIIDAPATVTVNRATASQIAYADVTGMLARVKYGGSLVWLASQTTIPQLTNLRDTGNNNLWVTAQAGLANSVPSTLAGFPLIFADRSPALGSKGDLMLCDMSYYLIKDGSGPIISVSEHVRFANDETAFRIVWNVDGQPWLSAPIPLEGSASNTVSPFVVLDVP